MPWHNSAGFLTAGKSALRSFDPYRATYAQLPVSNVHRRRSGNSRGQEQDQAHILLHPQWPPSSLTQDTHCSAPRSSQPTRRHARSSLPCGQAKASSSLRLPTTPLSNRCAFMQSHQPSLIEGLLCTSFADVVIYPGFRLIRILTVHSSPNTFHYHSSSWARNTPSRSAMAYPAPSPSPSSPTPSREPLPLHWLASSSWTSA